MQANLMQPAVQPYLKLVQSNTELLTRFWMSPEVMSQSLANVQSMLQQGQGSARNLVQSNAFAHLVQDMLKNFTEFMMEVGRSATSVIAQGQAQMVRQAEEVSANVDDVSEVSRRRSR